MSSWPNIWLYMSNWPDSTALDYKMPLIGGGLVHLIQVCQMVSWNLTWVCVILLLLQPTQLHSNINNNKKNEQQLPQKKLSDW